MKEVTIGILLLIWFLLTVGLVLTGIGLIILIADDTRSTWMQIGFDLKDALVK